MRILIAEDEPVSRLLLEKTLVRGGHELVVCTDGGQAWEALQQPSPPSLAILDWMMPELDGVDVCRKARQTEGLESLYIILVTSRDSEEDIVTGLDAGANDITKPFQPRELKARVGVGERVVELQHQLANRVVELEEGAEPSQDTAGPVADLLLLQEDPRRRQLLEAGGKLHRGPCRRQLQPRHLS
jgi:DNA-binding response OmpR family regulator